MAEDAQAGHHILHDDGGSLDGDAVCEPIQ